MFSAGILLDLSAAQFALLAAAALVTSSIHGATGLAGGFLMAAVLAQIIGVKPVVPVMSVALMISHSSRALFNLRDFDRIAFLCVLGAALPGLVLVAGLYGRLSSSWIATLLGALILLSIPLRRWAGRHHFRVGRRGLAGAGAVYGSLSGASVGPGMLLVPFMLGYGLSKEAFVATLAAIALVVNVTRVAVYGGTAQLGDGYLLLGLAIGVLTIPGNWFGRAMLRRMTTARHALLVDALTVVGALNFLWLAWYER